MAHHSQNHRPCLRLQIHDLFDFPVSSARDCLDKVSSFHPDVVMIEPESIVEDGENVLDSVNVPLVVLSRFSNNETFRSHPKVVEYYVKPAPLGAVADRIKQLLLG